MSIVLLLVGVLLTYVGAPSGLAVLLGRGEHTLPPAQRLAIGGALAPIGVAWLLWMAYVIVPEQPDVVYLAIIGTPLVILTALGIRWRGLRGVFAASGNEERQPYGWVVCSVVVGLVGLVIIQATVLPLTANDPLEYALVGRLLETRASLDGYPIDTALDSGLYAPASHPPAYHLTLSWLFLLQGTDQTLVVRIVAVFYGLLLTWVVGLVVAERGTLRGLYGAAMLLATPLLMLVIVIYHVDPMRIAVLFAGLVVSRWAVKEGGARPAAWAGITLGLAVFAHSIGLVAVPLLLAAILFTRSSTTWRQRLVRTTALGLIALTVGGGQFVLNTVRLGVPLADDVPVWDVDEVREQADLRHRRDLVTPGQRISNGVLVSFTDTDLFGMSMWLAVAGLALTYRRRDLSEVEMVCGWFILLFHSMAMLTMLLDMDLVIKNPRYSLTMLPFAAVLGARALEEVHLWVCGVPLLAKEQPSLDGQLPPKPLDAPSSAELPPAAGR